MIYVIKYLITYSEHLVIRTGKGDYFCPLSDSFPNPNLKYLLQKSLRIPYKILEFHEKAVEMEDYTMLRPSVLRAQKGNARET
jgi:hypothetical protein